MLVHAAPRSYPVKPLTGAPSLAPTMPCTQARIEALGGQILYWNGVRVMGVLAVSRAVGDHCLRPYVIAQPEVQPGAPGLRDELLPHAGEAAHMIPQWGVGSHSSYSLATRMSCSGHCCVC